MVLPTDGVVSQAADYVKRPLTILNKGQSSTTENDFENKIELCF